MFGRCECDAPRRSPNADPRAGPQSRAWLLGLGREAGRRARARTSGPEFKRPDAESPVPASSRPGSSVETGAEVTRFRHRLDRRALSRQINTVSTDKRCLDSRPPFSSADHAHDRQPRSRQTSTFSTADHHLETDERDAGRAPHRAHGSSPHRTHGSNPHRPRGARHARHAHHAHHATLSPAARPPAPRARRRGLRARARRGAR